MTTTFERLRAILVKDYKLDADKLALDSPLESLGIDSLGVAELLFNVEDEFKVTLPAEPVQLPTIGDVVRYIDALIAAQQPTAATPTPPAASLADAVAAMDVASGSPPIDDAEAAATAPSSPAR